MPGLFDDHDIDRVRQAVDIAEVIGAFVTLKRKGPDLWGLCPFHPEKSPSFHVRPDRGMFHCFGCGKGGNVFSFLMEIEGVSFSEAVRSLADRAGIEIRENRASAGADKSRTERDRLFQANEFAAKWFQNRLSSGAPEVAESSRNSDASRAWEYLAQRSLDAGIIKKFQLGWAGLESDNLVKAAAQSTIGGHILAQAGLAVRLRDGSGFADRFRGRIVFPIYNLSGKAVAFGARRIPGLTPDADEAKYINTAETSIYTKGETLYGLNWARDDIRKLGFAHLVEGYTDLLALVRAGFANTAASLGTSLTQGQIRLLKRFCSRVHVVYDSDSAGINAAIRAADLLTVSGLEARLIRLPDGDDPDSMLLRGGAQLLGEVLSQHSSFIQFRVETAGITPKLGPAARIEAARELLETIRSVHDPLQVDLLLKELTGLIGIRQEMLGKAMSEIKARVENTETTAVRTVLEFPPEQVYERDLIRALIADPTLIEECVSEINADTITDPALRDLFMLMERAYLRGEHLDRAALPDNFSDPAFRAFIAEAAVSSSSERETLREMVRGCIKGLAIWNLRQRCAEIESKIVSLAPDAGSTLELKKELISIQKRIREQIST